MNLLKQAKDFCLNKKFSVIPVEGKIPQISWKQYQTRLATAEEIETWFADGKSNIGIVTGKISNLLVVDLDEGYDPEFMKKLPKTTVVRTGAGGLHFYYRYPMGAEIKSKVGFRPHCDIRAEGGMVVAPPSIHPNGNEYCFAEDHPSWNTGGLTEAPMWLLDEISPNNQTPGKDNGWKTTLDGVEMGQRNDSAASVAGLILKKLDRKDWEIGWKLLSGWNMKNNPPLPESELRTTFESIANAESAKKTETHFPEWKIIRGEDLLSTEIPETEFLVERLIPKNGIAMIVGEPNSHKSWVMMEIAKAVSQGQELFGKFKTIKTKVLYIDSEVPFSEIKRRWRKLKSEANSEVYFMSLPGIRIDVEEDLKALLEIIKGQEYSLAIFDSFRDIWTGNENDSQQAQGVMNAFAAIQRLNCTILLSHHKPRSAMMGVSHAVRGSTVFEAKCDSVLVIKKSKETETMHEIIIQQTKLREGIKTPEFSAGMIEKGDHINFEFMGEITKEETAETKAREAISQLLAESGMMYESAILKLLKGQHAAATLRRAFKVMIKEGAVMFDHQGEKNRKYYRIPDAESQFPQPVCSLDAYQSQ